MKDKDFERKVVIRLANPKQKKIIMEAMNFYTGILHGEFERVWSLISSEYPECNKKIARFRNGVVVVQEVTRILHRVYLGEGIIPYLQPGKSVVKVHNFTQDVKMMKGLSIKCTVKEALIIRDCLNLYSRVLMGQIREIDWAMRDHHWDKIKNHDSRVANLLIGLLSEDLFGFSVNASFGIASKDNSEKSKIGYELLRWIEYDLFKDDPDVQNGHSVLRYEPLRVTKQKRLSLSIEDW